MTGPAARVALLRELAAEMDRLADGARGECTCPVHRVLAREYDRLATSYRQRAREAERG